MRIAVISPFVDRQHGTERAVAELVEGLARRGHDQVHLYTQRVADIELKGDEIGDGDGIVWHRVPSFPGPHLVGFLGWLFLNWWKRFRHHSGGNKEPEVIFSAGINAFDADVILVHVVFHKLAELQSSKSAIRLRSWHRRIYYSLLCSLEARIYRNPRTILAAVSQHTADQLSEYFGRRDVSVVPLGVDGQRFSPPAILAMRKASRNARNYDADEIVLLLIGNDWQNKGLGTALGALRTCADLPLRLIVVGQDARSPFRAEVAELGMNSRVEFCAPVPDVREYYATADILLAPSFEDSFNLPVLEAMACGIPVIVSACTGISAWLTHSQDALLLQDPRSPGELAAAIRVLATDGAQRQTMARFAQLRAADFSWEKHVSGIQILLAEAASKKAPKG